MKTFQEKIFGSSFNWNNALRKTNISPSEWDNLKLKASDWVTCACGNQCAIIPRWLDGSPIDRILRELGGRFYSEVIYQDKIAALQILEEIEERSAYLINKINESS